MRFRACAVVGSLAVAAAGAAHAGDDGWGPSHGPTPGPVVALAVHPTDTQIVYAGTPTVWEAGDVKSPGALYRSTNGGGRWVATGPEGVLAVTVDPRAPATAYVGTDFDGVLKSTDAGRTWRPARAGLPEIEVNTLAVHPSRPQVVYAGLGGYDGLFASADGGQHWRRSGLQQYTVEVVAIDPSAPSVLYGAIWDPQFANDPKNRFAKSSDGGRTWRVPEYGLRSIWSLAASPARAGTVFAGTTRGVFKSTDGGRRWSPSGLGKRGAVVAVVVDPRIATTAYAAEYNRGVFRSTNGGRTWTSMSKGLASLELRSLAISSNGRMLYAGTNGGVLAHRLSG